MAAERRTAKLVHKLAGRARLRFEELDGAALDQIATQLARHAAVIEIRVRPRTRSLLLKHEEGALDRLLRFAREQQLFEIEERPPPHPMRRLQSSLARLNDSLARQSQGTISLGSVTFFGLLAAGIYQAQRGYLLPAGLTLFRYGLTVMQNEAARELAESQARSADAPQA